MPHKFTDTQGRDWLVAIDYTTAKRVKVATGVNLFEVSDGSIFTQLASNPLVLADLLFVICEKQAADRKVTDDEFGRGLAGDVITAATESLVGAIIDFFPKGRRQVLTALSRKIEEVSAKASEQALTAIQAMSSDAILSSVSRMSLPELPELTPAHSASEK